MQTETVGRERTPHSVRAREMCSNTCGAVHLPGADLQEGSELGHGLRDGVLVGLGRIGLGALGDWPYVGHGRRLHPRTDVAH